MKRAYNRKMRRLFKMFGEDAPKVLPGFVAKGFCCGNHTSDWRY